MAAVTATEAVADAAAAAEAAALPPAAAAAALAAHLRQEMLTSNRIPGAPRGSHGGTVTRIEARTFRKMRTAQADIRNGTLRLRRFGIWVLLLFRTFTTLQVTLCA